MTCSTCRVSRGSVAAARSTAAATICARCFRPCVVARITDTCWPDTRPAANARANSGNACRSRAVATIADPACTVDPVAAATSVPVVPAPNTRESPWRVSGPGHRGQIGVQPVTDRRQRGHRPGPLLGAQQLRIRQPIEQPVDGVQHRRVLGGQLRADPRPPLRTPGHLEETHHTPLPTPTTLNRGYDISGAPQTAGVDSQQHTRRRRMPGSTGTARQISSPYCAHRR